MNNYTIADYFSLLSKLMDIHGENSFKSKSYGSAAFAIEKLPEQLSSIPTDKIESLKGIGFSTAQKIIEILESGELKVLNEIISKTPAGIIEMLSIKGIGPKKINTIWKEMEIESIGELLYACKENRLKNFKGFGEKTQNNVIDSIEFYFKSKGSFLYAQVKPFAIEIEQLLKEIFNTNLIFIVGDFARQLEIINQLEFVVNATSEEIENKLLAVDVFNLIEKTENEFIFSTPNGINIKLISVDNANLYEKCIQQSSSASFWNEVVKYKPNPFVSCKSEHHFFEQIGTNYIPPFLRESISIIDYSKNNLVEDVIQTTDIKGIIHCHSNWSDGSNTIEELAKAAIERGLEYLVISDHSQSAFYAQGLSVDRILAQHQLIDELNEKLYPFKIFKSIESDILNDGRLDYNDDILKRFDLVIASVHSNLKMTEEKAMSRLITAIENQYTTILGHMTGRLLLSRPGYPLDHKKIIDACAANNVVIELNAHPSRLDIDWRYIDYVLEKNVLISIDPDAHHIDGFNDLKFGVSVAQKAMVKKENNLSSFNLAEFEKYLVTLKK
jgi:DNA polymerase (family 10)